MNAKKESKLKKLGVFTRRQAEALGLSHQELSRLVAAQKLKRVGRGIYLHPETDIGRDMDYRVACAKFGSESVIGGLTALFHYNLIEQVPGHVWVLVPSEKKSNESLYRLIRTKVNLNREIIHEKGYRIVSLERAIIEGLKLASKIGERSAVKAARDALNNRQTTEARLGKAAKELGLESVLQKYFEVILV
jgi:predicted transcriptional regulator of viral defense system